MADITFKTLWQRLTNEDIFIDDLIKLKDQFNAFAIKVISGKLSPDNPELESFIKLCNDVYTYSPDGEVMISDSLYDQCMQVYKSTGKDTIIFADMIGRTIFAPTEIPVGIVMALIGAPFFLYLLLSKRGK